MPSVGSSPCRPEPPKAPFGKRPLPPFITTVDVPPRGADSGVSEKPSESGESVARDILVLDPDMFNEGVRADVDLTSSSARPREPRRLPLRHAKLRAHLLRRRT